MIHLLNGTKEPRVRSSDGVRVLECGCAHTDVLWLQECRPHSIESNALHERARQDHKRQAIEELIS